MSVEAVGLKSTLNNLIPVAMAFLHDIYFPLRWFMLFAVVLVLFDCRWGVAAAKKRGEKVRFSRAGRRTIQKMVDYFCWITIAGLIETLFEADMAIYGIPVGQGLLLIFIYLFEVNSCYNNYCEARCIETWDIIGWVGEKTNLKRKEKE